MVRAKWWPVEALVVKTSFVWLLDTEIRYWKDYPQADAKDRKIAVIGGSGRNTEWIWLLSKIIIWEKGINFTWSVQTWPKMACFRTFDWLGPLRNQPPRKSGLQTDHQAAGIVGQRFRGRKSGVYELSW
jgi:hypothetical protein